MAQRLEPSSLSLSPYSGSWGFSQAAHLLRRTMFGATVQDITTVQAMTMSQAVDALLADDPTPIGNPLVWYHYDINGVTQGQTWVDLPYDSGNDFNRNESLAAWWLGLMLSQSISIREKMVLFWHNHFACGVVTVDDARYMYVQNTLLRNKALGNYKSLVKSITLDPAMLRYLSGNQNVRTAPNENYGRELQELFSIGKGAEVAVGDYTTYTEADVKAAARVLTGWKDDQKTITPVFTPADHDSTDKQFSQRYGNQVIKGQSDKSGAAQEIDDLLKMIFAQEETAKYICRKLFRWFVDYVIDDAIEQQVIAPLAQTLITNNFEILPVLSELFKSTMFYDAAFVGCVIKTPMDLIIGSIRVLDVVMPVKDVVISQYYGWIGLRQTGASQQMKLLEPPNVAGWPAYYQTPHYHELWINSATLNSRITFLEQIVTNKYSIAVQTYYMTSIDPTVFAKRTSDPTNPDTLIADWAKFLLPTPLTADQLTTLHNVFLPGLPNYEWAAEWSAFLGSPNDSAKKMAVSNKLTTLLKYMLELAEYQLM